MILFKSLVLIAIYQNHFCIALENTAPLRNGIPSIRNVECKSSASVSCTIKDSGMDCSNYLKVKKSDCDANNNKIPVTLNIKWKYCNKGTQPQKPNVSKTEAKYRDWIKVDENEVNLLQPEDCVELTSEKNINVCKSEGTNMSMKYVATVPKSGSYCYSYDFLSVKKEWLPDGLCALTTQIGCEIDSGAREGKSCQGNIIASENNNDCQDIPVTFKYEYCNYNRVDGQFLIFTKKESWHNLRGKKIKPSIDRTNMLGNGICRTQEKKTKIDTCSKKNNAQMQLTTTLSDQDETCFAEERIRIVPARPCQYDFIITEITDPEDKPDRYIEIYTPNCAGQIITEDLYIVMIKKTKTNPIVDSAIKLNGREIPADGFFVFCATEGSTYDSGKCDEVIAGNNSPANTQGHDSIAITDGIDNYKILDFFGKIGEDGKDTKYDFSTGRAVRNPFKTDQSFPWDVFKSVKSEDNSPRKWSVSKSPSKNPTFNPINSPSFAPTNLPSSNPSDEPTIEPSNSSRPSSIPTSRPSSIPSNKPSSIPSNDPTSSIPTNKPSSIPSSYPTSNPSSIPTSRPSSIPTSKPSISYHPSSIPTSKPSSIPTSEPSSIPSSDPTSKPSSIPSSDPTSKPSSLPSTYPTSSIPTSKPSSIPSSYPTRNPSFIPSSDPTSSPSSIPSRDPTSEPSSIPTNKPSSIPSRDPTSSPSSIPSSDPTSEPSSIPTNKPSSILSRDPTSSPSSIPSSDPTSEPSTIPTNKPSSIPSRDPTSSPSSIPSSDPTSEPSSIPSSDSTTEPSSRSKRQKSKSKKKKKKKKKKKTTTTAKSSKKKRYMPWLNVP